MPQDARFYEMFGKMHDQVEEHEAFVKRRDDLQPIIQDLVNRAWALVEAKKMSVRYYENLFEKLVSMASNQNWRAEIKKVGAKLAKLAG